MNSVHNCFWCGKREYSFILTRKDGLNVIKCSNCGLIQLDQVPDNLFDIYYENNYFEKKSEDQDKLMGYSDYHSIPIHKFLWQYAFLKLVSGESKGTLLDVGCASGKFLELAEMAGFLPFGIDISPEAITLSKVKGFSVFCGSLEEFKSESEKFDVISAWDFVEHIENHKEFLIECKRLLKENGVLIFSTPDAGSKVAKEKKEEWIGYASSFEHVSFMDYDFLSKALCEIFGSKPQIYQYPCGEWTTLIGYVRKGGMTSYDENLNINLKSMTYPTDIKENWKNIIDMSFLYLYFDFNPNKLLEEIKFIEIFVPKGETNLLKSLIYIKQGNFSKAHRLLQDLRKVSKRDSLIWQINVDLLQESLDEKERLFSEKVNDFYSLQKTNMDLENEINAKREELLFLRKFTSTLESELRSKKEEILSLNKINSALENEITSKNQEIAIVLETLRQRENSLAWKLSQLYGKHFSPDSLITKNITRCARLIIHDRVEDQPAKDIQLESVVSNKRVESLVISSAEKVRLALPKSVFITDDKIYYGQKKDKVSVILPVYNQADMLEESILSVLNQTYQDFELIVVNDGSTDNIKPILDKYADHSKVLILTQENRKLPKALTNGFRLAQGEFHTWTSADNIMLPEQLEKQVKFLKENPDADMVYCDYEAIDDRGMPLVNSNFRVHNQKPIGSSYIHLPKSAEKLGLEKDNFIGPCFMYRGLVSKVIDEYDPNAFGCEDYDYWMRINDLFSIKHIGKEDILYRYRVHDNTLCAKAEELGIYEKVNRLMNYESERSEFYNNKFDIFSNGDALFEILREFYKKFDFNIIQIKDLKDVDNCRSFSKCILFSNDNEVKNLFSKLQENKDIFKVIFVKNEINENIVCNEAFKASDCIITSNEKSYNLLYNKYPQKIFLVPLINDNILDVIVKFANNKIFYNLTRPKETHALPQIYLNKTINVLIETRSLDKGGLEQVIFDLATNLDKNLFKLFIACIEKDGYIAEKCRESGITVFTVNNNEEQYEKILIEENIDLINSHYSNFGLKIASKLDIPVVSVIHNNYVWLDSLEIQEFKKADKNITNYIAVSKNVSRYSRHYFEIDARKINIVPNGLNIERYNKLLKSNLKNRKDFGLKDEDFIFLNVAAYQGAKGHNLIISAMRELVEKYPLIKVVCVGHVFDSVYYNTIRERVRSYNLENNIIFTEFIPETDLICLYKESNAFLLPSLFEGWSVSVMEAMFFGLPVILTDVGSSRDVIKDNDIGLIISNSYGDIVNLNYSNLTQLFSEETPKNKEDLMKAMIEFYENRTKWKKNGENGIEKITNYFSIDETIKSYEKIFISTYKRIQNCSCVLPIILDSSEKNDYASEMKFGGLVHQRYKIKNF